MAWSGFLFDETKLLIDDTFSFINVMISQTILALQRQQARKKAAGNPSGNRKGKNAEQPFACSFA